MQADWNEVNNTVDSYIKNKPTVFPPVSHTHTSSEISDFAITVNGLNSDTVTTINGQIQQGANITITGNGTIASPYIIDATSGGTTLSFLEIEVDFGTTPVSSKKFNIIDPLVSATNTIIVTPSTNAATDRFGNDWEFDMPFFSAKSNNGNLDIYATFNHYVVGKRKIKYTKI